MTRQKWAGRKTTALRALVAATYGGRCWVCGQPLDPRRWDVDHVRRRIDCRECGGQINTCPICNHISNLRPACWPCNRGGRRPADREGWWPKQ